MIFNNVEHKYKIRSNNSDVIDVKNYNDNNSIKRHLITFKYDYNKNQIKYNQKYAEESYITFK